MLQFVLSLPTLAGGLLFVLLAISAGLLVYIASNHFLSRYDRTELIDPIGSIFRVIGILFSLMLSLTFTEVVIELKGIQKSIEQESVALVDTFNGLLRFDSNEQSAAARTILIQYTRSIVEDDWPAFAKGQPGEKTTALKDQLEDAVYNLEPSGAKEEKIWDQIVADMDRITNYRVMRFDAALETVPFYTYVIVLGFLITMACFAAYRPLFPVLVFVSLYAGFVGLLLYLILALSEPFQGDIGADNETFVRIANVLESKVAH